MIAEEFFAPIAEEVFGRLLQSLGAVRTRVTDTMVRFEASLWFVELIVLPEDGPRYCPRVEIGPVPERSADDRDRLVDIMHAVPSGSPLRRYNLEWRYENPGEMREVYRRTRDEIFVPFAVPLLAHPGALERLVSATSQAVHEQWRNEIADHNDAVFRSKAEAALGAKDYLGYLDEMGNIPVDRLTDSELARIRYAEKKSSD